MRMRMVSQLVAHEGTVSYLVASHGGDTLLSIRMVSYLVTHEGR